MHGFLNELCMTFYMYLSSNFMLIPFLLFFSIFAAPQSAVDSNQTIRIYGEKSVPTFITEVKSVVTKAVVLIHTNCLFLELYWTSFNHLKYHSPFHQKENTSPFISSSLRSENPTEYMYKFGLCGNFLIHQ